MAAIETQIIGGVVALIMGVFGWMFKNTATRANNASALSKELKNRVDKIDEELKLIRRIEVDQGVIKNDISHMKNDMAKIANHLERKLRDGL
jgi:hypothetical protein